MMIVLEREECFRASKMYFQWQREISTSGEKEETGDKERKREENKRKKEDAWF